MESPRIIDIHLLKNIKTLDYEELLFMMNVIKEKHIYESLSIIESKVIWKFEIILNVISFINNENLKYKIIILLKKYIINLTIDNLIRLLNVFNVEIYKYKLFNKFISVTFFLFDDNSKIINIFHDMKLKSNVIKSLIQLKKNINYSNVIKMLNSYPDNKLEALERSIRYSGIKLGDVSEYCENIREMFISDDYIIASEILGIDPDIFNLFI